MPENATQAAGGYDARLAIPCGLGRRLLVMAYDAVAVVALMMAVTAVGLLTPLREQTALKDPAPTALLLLTWFVYLVWCWRSGMTVGMRAWRVRLVSDDGSVPGWGRCLLRFAVSLLSVAALGLGFIRALFDRQRRTWHDLASGSRLVRTGGKSHRSSQHEDRAQAK